jgi:hypothetical protein
VGWGWVKTRSGVPGTLIDVQEQEEEEEGVKEESLQQSEYHSLL